MAFTDEARLLIREIVPRYQEQAANYVARTLARDEMDAEMARGQIRWKTPLDDDSRDIIHDNALGDLGSIALVGSAGSGKSQILVTSFLTACERFLTRDAQPFPFFLDLGTQLATDLNIEMALASWSRGLFARSLTENLNGAILFLDSLDEALLKTRDMAFYNNMRFFLDALPPQVKTVVACRRPFWYPERLRGLKCEIVAYNCDFLEPEAYERLIPQGDERRLFLSAARDLGIRSMLDSPFFGFDLARAFLRGEPLPPNRLSWFGSQINRLLAGTPADQAHADYVPVQRLVAIGQQLACLESFASPGAWTAANALEALNESSVLRENHPPQWLELDLLFQRPLFRKTGQTFSFCHQLFREYLAASAISNLPLRKQRQLLEAPLGRSQHRILLQRRGIAIDLAEMSPAFSSFLIENDPLVAFISETTGLSPEDDERLTRTVIENGIAENRAPWWEVPPRGDRPQDWFWRHRPRDKAAFIGGYLQHPNEIARLWGTAAIAAWGGVAEVNARLIALAHDTTQHTEIRRQAIEAVAGSGVVEDVRQLYDLLESEDDIVHGAALDAYRVTEHPAPRDFIAKLMTPPHNEHLICMLEIEPEIYALSLDIAQLPEAYAETDRRYSDIRGFIDHLMRGLLRRSRELSYRDIPATLVLKIWRGGADYGIDYDTTLNAFLQDNWPVLAAVWRLMLERSANPDYRGELLYAERCFLEHCTDQLFDVLPLEGELTPEQKRFVEDTVAAYFYKSPSAERLAVFQNRAGPYASRLRLPLPRPPSAPSDAPDQIAGILQNATGTSYQRTMRVLRAIWSSRPPNSGEDWIGFIRVFLQQVPDPLRRQVLDLFAQCVEETHYERSVDAQGQVSLTNPQASVPFWVLLDFEHECPLEKKVEIVLCYGFRDDVGLDRMAHLLDGLERADHAQWEQCLASLAEVHRVSPHHFLNYLTERHLDSYVPTCREQLLNGTFRAGAYDALLLYWAARRPADYAEVLQANYRLRQEQQNRATQPEAGSIAESALDLPTWSDMFPLLLLVREDNDWAWQELHDRVRAEDVPVNAHDLYGPFYRDIQFPLKPSRLPILADWYALTRRNSTEDKVEELGQRLLEAIIQIDGDQAVAELRRLVTERAFPGAEWLSHSIMRIQDRQLQAAEQAMPRGELLDFVNREHLGVVQNSRDLFEWTCQAVEEIKEDIELRAEQVIGYWNHDPRGPWHPKEEVPCHNVFWPMLRAKLEHLRVMAIDERRIAANSADFWVEKTVGQANAQVVVEMKTAREGYAEAELIDPIRSQLWDKYLRPTGAQYGIFLVLWFKDAKRYPYPSKWETRQEYERALEAARSQIAAECDLNLACYIIDMTTKPRLH
ncbi:MAG: hypothetical protein M1132_10980 [Chloroflexi bacterium]|nr:hypothetical protein [Chloroflexota bacterium]